jgi:hypothetical protein
MTQRFASATAFYPENIEEQLTNLLVPHVLTAKRKRDQRYSSGYAA